MASTNWDLLHARFDALGEVIGALTEAVGVILANQAETLVRLDELSAQVGSEVGALSEKLDAEAESGEWIVGTAPTPYQCSVITPDVQVRFGSGGDG